MGGLMGASWDLSIISRSKGSFLSCNREYGDEANCNLPLLYSLTILRQPQNFYVLVLVLLRWHDNHHRKYQFHIVTV